MPDCANPEGGDHARDRVGLSPQGSATTPTVADPTPLDHAIRAAHKALRIQIGGIHPWLEAARVAVEAAWETLTQPLADLQRDPDYATWPEARGHEAAAELDRLTTFEVAIRNALKPWTWSGIDADGKNYRDVVEEVAQAVTDLDQRRERTHD